MGLTDKMYKKLMSNPEVQFKMILGFMDSLIIGMDQVTDDVIKDVKLPLSDYHSKLLDLYNVTEKNLHRVGKEVCLDE